jgi:hypothetical protein
MVTRINTGIFPYDCLRKLIAIVAAAGIIAAAIIGIGLYSFTKLPQQNAQTPALDNPAASENDTADDQNVSDASTNATQEQTIYNTFLGAGWPEESARIFSSIKTEFHESNSTYVRYTQTLPSGLINDVRITVTPGENYVPVEADKLYTHFGTVVYLKDATFYSGPDFNATKTSYFLPYDSLDSELIQQLGWEDPHLQPADLQFPVMQYASATTETTGVGMERTAIRSAESSAASADMDARLADAEADSIRFERERAYESIFEEGREITNQAPNDPVVQEVNRHLTPEAVELRRQQAAFHDAETRRMVDEIRTRYELADNARVNTKWLVRIGGALGTGLAGYELYTIDNQYDTRSLWLQYYEDCVRNPDIPRFNDPRGDPGFDQAIEQIESAREGLRVSSAAMAGASVVNGVAGLVGHNPIIDGVTMAASMVEQALLERAIQDEMSGLSELNSPCRPPPCEDDPPSPPPSTPSGDHTPGPDEPGFYYTIGPRESYEPPERRICKPPEPNQVTVTIRYFEDGSTGTPREVTFVATANVTNIFPIPGSGGSLYQVDNYYLGNATSFYSDTTRSPDATIPAGECVVDIRGDATMKVRIQRHMSGTMVDGVYELAEVNVEIVGDLPISQSPAGCYVHNGIVPSSTGQIGGVVYGCNFFDVAETGGNYKNGSGPKSLDNTNIFYDDCELSMGPIIQELMVPG